STFMVGDHESESEMADRAVALNPNSFFAWFNKGWVYEIAGLPEDALRSFECAVRMSPVDPLLHIALAGMGHAFIELRRFAEDSAAGQTAQRQNPSCSIACRCPASAVAALGRDAEAREAGARVLELDPAFTLSAFFGRAPVLGQLGTKALIEGLRKAGLPE